MGAEQPGTGVLVPDPQGLERQDQCVDRKLGQQKEPDALGPLLLLMLLALVASHDRDVPLRQLLRGSSSPCRPRSTPSRTAREINGVSDPYLCARTHPH